jgi:hypothetical protein
MLTFIKYIRQPHAIRNLHRAHCENKVHYFPSPKLLNCVKVKAAQAQIAQNKERRNNNNKELTDITCQAVRVFQFSVKKMLQTSQQLLYLQDMRQILRVTLFWHRLYENMQF